MMMSMSMKMPKNIEGGSRVSSVSSLQCSVYVYECVRRLCL